MTDAEAFIQAIAANPDDDLPRLVFADWLDENGDPIRAGFIRDHVQLAKLRPGTAEFKTLFRKCADTLRANLPAWIKPACDAFGQPAEWKPTEAVSGLFPIWVNKPIDKPLYRLEFGRGFVEAASLGVPAGMDLRPLDRVLAEYPIHRVTLWLGLCVPQWADHLTERFRAVRTLTITGTAVPASSEAVFNNPHTAGVTQLNIDCVLQGPVEVLCRSPMAKRLTELRVLGEWDIIRALGEFPLDDQLQQFTVLSGPDRTNVRLKIGTATYLGGYVSQVPFRPTLKRLALSGCNLSDEDLVRFARGEEWVRLQGLKLGGNLFGDRGWADFCRGWRTPELTSLDASRNRLSDAGAEMLARSGMVRTLRMIDLRGNRIAGRGAVALARAVAEEKLNRLLLVGNPLGKRDAATVKGLLGERTDVASGAT